MDDPAWVRRRLEIMLRNLERLPDQYDAMRRIFPQWRDQRILTIAAIDEFKGKLDSVFQAACVASGVSSATSLLGTVSSLVGILLSWKGISASSSWISAGSKLSTAGNIALPAVSLAEYGFTTSYMSQVQGYLDEDREISRPILQYLEYSRNLDQVMQEVFGCSVYSDIWQDVVACWNESIDIATNTGRDVGNIADMLRRRLGGKIPEDIMEEIGNAFRRNGGRMLNSAGRGCLRTFQRIEELVRLPHVSMAISGVKVYSHVIGIRNGELAGSPLTRIEWGQSGNWSIAGHCLAEVANVALDVLNLIQRYNGIMDGQSNYSRRLEEIKQQLNRELTAIETSILLNRLDENH